VLARTKYRAGCGPEVVADAVGRRRVWRNSRGRAARARGRLDQEKMTLKSVRSIKSLSQRPVPDKESVEALVLRAKIERMSRHVGRIAIVVFVVCILASIVSRFFRPALWY
jgi:hypothetical protein